MLNATFLDDFQKLFLFLAEHTVLNMMCVLYWLYSLAVPFLFRSRPTPIGNIPVEANKLLEAEHNRKSSLSTSVGTLSKSKLSFTSFGSELYLFLEDEV